MNIQTRKLNFIQQVLAIRNEKLIEKLEALLKKEKSNMSIKTSAHEFLGVITVEEAEAMRKEIEAACESIHEDDWK